MKKIVFIILALSLYSSAYTKVIELKNGKTIEGKIIERTKEYIKIDVVGVPITYYLNEIKSVVVEEEEEEQISSLLTQENIKYTEGISNDFRYNLSVGTQHYELGQMDKALPYLQRAVKINPNNLAANIAAGVVSRYLKRYNQALTFLKKAKEIDPSNTNFWFELGYAYYNVKQFDKAREILQEVKKLSQAQGNYQELQIVEMLLKKMSYERRGDDKNF